MKLQSIFLRKFHLHFLPDFVPALTDSRVGS